MTDTFHLKIVSPAAIVLDEQVAMAEAPGTEGDFGVLPKHAPFFSMLRSGVITIHFQDGSSRRFFASSGYADVSEEGCTILSDHILDMAEMYPNAAEEALAAAREALAKADTEQERMEAQKQLMNAEALSLALAA